MSDALLKVEGLTVRFDAFTALDDVSFELWPGETLGLVGESGSGKSTLARVILSLIPAASGEILWCGEDVAAWSKRELRRRRRDLQIVFQDPLASLNPRMTVGTALAEPLALFEPHLSRQQRSMRVAEMLQRVGLSEAAAPRYPHQFSGGQCQRIGIARAMITNPKLLVCDEPVSSLDVSIQGQVINLLSDLQRDLGTTLLFISHNLAVVRHLSHRVLVIFRGRLVEIATCETLFAAPAHPYTQALLAAVPDPTRMLTAKPLTHAQDSTPEQPAAGCAYQNRCPHVQAVCLAQVPALEAVQPGHSVACHRWREVVYS